MGDFFTDDEFAFDEWDTPFKNAEISLEAVKYTGNGKLEFVVALIDNAAIRYQLEFDYVSAFRVLEHFQQKCETVLRRIMRQNK